MFSPKFMKNIPGNSLQISLESLPRLLWNLSWKHNHGTWLVFAGDRLLFETDSEDTIWAFVYGLSSAYGVLPDPLLRDFEEYCESIRSGTNVEFLKRKGWRLS